MLNSKIKSIIILALSIPLIALGCGKKDNTSDETTQEEKITTSSGNVVEVAEIKLPTIQCSMCKKTITKALNKADGINKIHIDVDGKLAHINYDKNKIDIAKIENIISAAGYDANNVKADANAYENLDDCCKLPKDRKEKSSH